MQLFSTRRTLKEAFKYSGYIGWKVVVKEGHCAPRNQSKTNFIQLPSQNQKDLNMTNYNKKQALDIGACN